ncbi:MAG: hypothetical protein M1828_002947 [Chrysothrix sp. TS-e1954]|nr:MAG: hypothetical protein M1828_002947 [Chrysothrix sp. TS-e1954]
MSSSTVVSKGAGAGAAHMATTTLKVEGMTCGSCTSSVESAFKDVDGVGNVSVSLVMERAVVQHDASKISPEQVKEIIEDRGFDAEVLSHDAPLPALAQVGDEDNTESRRTAYSITTLTITGMTCGACTSAVEGAFKDVAGVRSISVSLLSSRAVVEHDTSLISPEKVAENIEEAGFDAEVLSTKPATETTARHTRRRSSVPTTSKATTVAIEGMTCGACTSAIEGGFKDVKGVKQFSISLLAERAVIIHEPLLLSEDQIVEAIEDRGFDARIVSSQFTDSSGLSTISTVQLKVFGVPDSQAAAELGRRLESLAGVTMASISEKTARASVTMDNAIIGLRAIVDAIEAAGYNALLADTDDNNAQLESLAKTKEIQEWRRAFRISLSFAIPVFLTSMIFPMFIKPLDYGRIKLPIPGLWLGDVMCLFLTIPVQFGIGRRFYKSAFKSLRHGSPTMDVLVVLGTSAAFFFSLAAMSVSVFTPPHSRPATVFDTSTMLITFITFGRYLENGAKSQTSRALSRLMSLAPSMATIYVDPIAAEKAVEELKSTSSLEKVPEQDRLSTMVEEKVVPTDLVQVGDIVILRPGDKVPADGTVVRGASYVDESMVTGEAMPVLKPPGGTLMAGTVIGASRVDFKVTRAGRDTQLSQIVRLVQEAQTSRAPIQRMADIVAGYFVPIIIGLGLITFFGWMVLSHVLAHPPGVFLGHASGGKFMVCLKLCISVIVFACPCALGLSTPTAVMVGTGVGAEQGILVKGGAALETATKVSHVIFDKTGTLTTGKMSVSRVDDEAWFQTGPKMELKDSKRLWWTLVGLAESSSEHPIGKAVVQEAKRSLGLGAESNFNGSIDQFEALVGQGIMASIKTTVASSRRTFTVLAGSASFLHSHRISTPNAHNPVPINSTTSLNDDATAAGNTSIYVAIDAEYTGSLSLSDTLKSSAADTVAALTRLGISSSLVTGDSLSTALAIASTVGISEANVHASCTPSSKQDLIRDMQAAGQVIAMVGDGINDSPALATANIGISLASGTDVAMEAADVVLMRSGPDDLLDVAAAFHLATTIFRRIKLNLLWACAYNLIGLPFAMGFFLPWGLSLHPMAAGAAMAASSVSVVVSSLLLKFWRRPAWMETENLESERRPWIRPAPWVVELASRIKTTFRGRRANDIAYVPLSTVEPV